MLLGGCTTDMAPEGPVASLPSGLANIGSPQATAKEGRDGYFGHLKERLQHIPVDQRRESSDAVTQCQRMSEDIGDANIGAATASVRMDNFDFFIIRFEFSSTSTALLTVLGASVCMAADGTLWSGAINPSQEA
ncbi:unnamed protein product [Gadus morhua 'NCC']